MSFGSGSTPKAPKPTPPPPVSSGIEVQASKRSLQERLNRARGRSDTQLTQAGSLYNPTIMRKTLG